MTFRKTFRTSKRFQTVFVSIKPTCRLFPSAGHEIWSLPDSESVEASRPPYRLPNSFQMPNKVCRIIYVIQIGKAYLDSLRP